MASKQNSRVHERWAHLRFSIVGRLLASPPPAGELRAEIEKLAVQEWQHPITGAPTRFSFSSIERWFYQSLRQRNDPVGALRRKVRSNAGQQIAMSDAVRQALLAQYAAHKSWSIQLHRDNLLALAETQPELQPIASYATINKQCLRVLVLPNRKTTCRRSRSDIRATAACMT